MEIKPEGESNFDFRVINNHASYTISLSVKELVYVDDSISLLVNREDQFQSTPLRGSMPTNSIGAPIELIQKVGIAILGAFETIGPVDLHVTELELMILRELAHSSVRNDDILIGLALKRKVYHALWGDKVKAEEMRAKIEQDLLSTLESIVKTDPSAGKFFDEANKKEE